MLFKKGIYLLFEKESRAEGQRERKSQADSRLSMRPFTGLDPTSPEFMTK